MKALRFAVLPVLLVSSVAVAQQDSGTQNIPGMEQMPGMQMSGGGSMNMHPATFVQEILTHDTSGTSAQPDSTSAPMLMRTARSWTLMFHANVFVLDEQQSSVRGGDKFFSTNWLMGMAQHDAGAGKFTIRAMLTLEPATITGERYPLLFQQGETAYGVPIADGQHPHNLVMELAALYDLKLGDNALLSFYAAPTGDPASDLPRIRIAPPPPKIQSPRSAIIRRIPRMSPPTSSPPVSLTASCVSKRPAFTDASQGRIAGTSSRAKSIPGPRASPSSPERIGAANILTAASPAPRRSFPPKIRSA